MRRTLYYSIAIIFLLLQCGFVLGESAAQLDQATIAVPDRSITVLSKALQTAFSQVLVRLSGNPHVMTLPVIEDATSNFQQWVRSYSYSNDDSLTGNAHLKLQVQFDTSGIKQLLRDAGQPVWTSERPLTLIYLDDDDQTLQNNIQKLAKVRGLPVIFPVMDLADQSVLDTQDQQTDQTLSADQVQKLSSRYGVHAILTGHLQQSGDSWQASGEYMLNGQNIPWHVSTDDQSRLADVLVNQLTSMMVSQLVVTDNAALQSKITMQVVGVNDVASYAKVMRYLRQCKEVAHVSVKDMGSSSMLLSLTIIGDKSRFTQALAVDHQLKPVNAALAENNHQADLYYYWG